MGSKVSSYIFPELSYFYRIYFMYFYLTLNPLLYAPPPQHFFHVIPLLSFMSFLSFHLCHSHPFISCHSHPFISCHSHPFILCHSLFSFYHFMSLPPFILCHSLLSFYHFMSLPPAFFDVLL